MYRGLVLIFSLVLGLLLKSFPTKKRSDFSIFFFFTKNLWLFLLLNESVMILSFNGLVPIVPWVISAWTSRGSGTGMAMDAFKIQFGAFFVMHADVLKHALRPPSEILTFLVLVTP